MDYRRRRGGSSPRGRGKLILQAVLVAAGRLIPARAGKTHGRRRGGPGTWAHPRAGGENASSSEDRNSSGGSSPRGRGKLHAGDEGTRHPGLIPARAGKTRSTPAPGTGSRAHPRAGGENSVSRRTGVVGRGSSPRGRGKRAFVRRGLRLVRLIPARAGKTPASPACQGAGPAHPRAGGENTVRRETSGRVFGSSPRGRGKLPRSRPSAISQRLIPARAGKTTAQLAANGVEGAHPRAGGENTFSRKLNGHADGSSPRGRGKPDLARMRVGTVRLIPARAGKTRYLPDFQ